MNIYLHNGQEQFGPYSEEDVRGWIESGNVTGEFQFFIEGQSTEWALVHGSFLMPVHSLSPEENFQKLVRTIQEEFELLRNQKKSFIGKMFDGPKKPLDECSVMVVFQEGKKEYGPYRLEYAISYDNIDTAHSIRIEGTNTTFKFPKMRQMWEQALLTSKQSKKLEKFGLTVEGIEITNIQAIDAIQRLDEAHKIIKDTKKALDELKPPTPTLKKKMKELGIDPSEVKTRADARKLIEDQIIYNRCIELSISIPEGCTSEMAVSLIEKKEASIAKSNQKKEKEESIARLQAKGIHLNLPINDEELEDIIEYGPPSHEQIFEYNKLMSEFHQKLGIEFKPYGKKETANHSSDSIQFSIDMLDDVICGIESWDDEVDSQFVQGEDCYDLSRTPTQEEWLEIRRALAKLIMKEEHIGDDQVIRRILKKCCPGMKIKKEKY